MDEAPQPLVSIIISTRNRARQLPGSLEAIARLQTTIPWELVVVDNGSSDDTADVIRGFAAQSGLVVRSVMQPQVGLSNARNAGLREARGHIIAFTDDDCYVQPDYLDRIVAAFEDPRVGFITGRIMLHDPSDYPVTINESRVPQTMPAGSYIYAGMVKGANMAFRHETLSDIEGFDPRFGSGALFPAEDCDAAGRASLKGWVGKYVPDVVVSHHHGRKAKDVERLFQAYDVGRGAYHMKLLLQPGGFRPFVRGWLGLPRRARSRPSSIVWELVGAARFLYSR